MGDKTSKSKGKPKGKPKGKRPAANKPSDPPTPGDGGGPALEGGPTHGEPTKQPEPVGNADADGAGDAAYYCPGCGQRYADGPSLCIGTPTAAHPEIETVSTDELELGPEHHTPAPASE